MILQRLVEHYDRLEASGAVTLAKPGFSQQKISFCIVLEPDGQLNSFEDMLPLGQRRVPAGVDRRLAAQGTSRSCLRRIAPHAPWP